MLPKSCSVTDISNKTAQRENGENRLRKAQSEEGSDIFDYNLDHEITGSISQFSGILQIAPPITISSISVEKNGKFELAPEPKNDGLTAKFVGFFKKHLKIIPVMRTSSSSSSPTPSQNPEPNQKKKKKKTSDSADDVDDDGVVVIVVDDDNDGKKVAEMMDSDSAVYEIDELNSTIAPSSSRQCIVGDDDVECAVVVKKAKKKTKMMQQRTEFHPRPPFSCVPIYTAILLGLLVVLIVGAVTTIVDMRPELIYGAAEASANSTEPAIEFSTLKPQ